MDELEMIADLCKKHDVIVIADEVYEWMIYKGHKHHRIGNSTSSNSAGVISAF